MENTSEERRRGQGKIDKTQNQRLSQTIMLNLFMHSVMQLFLTQNPPKTDDNTSNTGEERRIVSRTIAAQSIGTITLTIRSHDGVLVVDGAVEQVEDITAENRREGHGAPVLREAADAERVGYERGEDAEQEAVGYACHARDED